MDSMNEAPLARTNDAAMRDANTGSSRTSTAYTGETPASSGRHVASSPNNHILGKRRRIEEHLEREAQYEQLATRKSELRWNSDDIGPFHDKILLPEIRENRVFDDFSRDGISTLDAGRGDLVNWVARDVGRPPQATAYLIKGAADELSAEAVKNTILELCKRHNAPIYNIRLELESQNAGLADLHAVSSSPANSAGHRPILAARCPRVPPTGDMRNHGRLNAERFDPPTFQRATQAPPEAALDRRRVLDIDGRILSGVVSGGGEVFDSKAIKNEAEADDLDTDMLGGAQARVVNKANWQTNAVVSEDDPGVPKRQTRDVVADFMASLGRGSPRPPRSTAANPIVPLGSRGGVQRATATTDTATTDTPTADTPTSRGRAT